MALPMYSYSPGDLQSYSPSPPRGMHRGALVLLLCALLGITGAISYAAYASNTVTTPIPVRQPIVASVPTTRKQLVLHAKTVSTNGTTKATARTTQPTHTTKVTTHPTHTPIAGSKPTPTSSPVPISSHPIYDGNTSLPEVALTFDDGPNPYYTAQILSVLKQYDVKATFFDVGYLVQDYPAIVRAEYDQGHIVADHSWSHPDLTRMSYNSIYSQLSAAAQAIHSAIGVYPTFFRP
ncbi:MAG TPA: polysaccharide deacetylase family protein, partial [Ktedonobacteraceae bacterium]|nr:polysaccharide deacetylase family protein [Ktedonobacteraceae bacterium]